MTQKLDEYLQPVNAPVSQDRNYVSALDFDQQYSVPLNAINYTNINSSSRTYTAIVSLSGEVGTFKDIQLAINYVNKIGGGVVFIRNGTYTISADILMYSSIDLIGENRQNTILDFNTGAYKINCTSLTNMSIQNLTIKNARHTDGAIYTNGSSYTKLKDLVFIDNSAASGTGVDIHLNGTNIEVSFCNATGSGSFIKATLQSVGYYINNNTVSGCISNIIEASVGGVGGFIHGNNFYACHKSAIYGIVYTGTKIVNNLFEIYDTNNSDALHLIDFYAGAITGNFILSVGGHGIFGSNIDSVSIAGNSVFGQGASKSGIHLENNSAENAITGNTIGGSSYAVNLSTAGTNYNAVVGNALNGATNDAGTGNVLANNS